jgi:hypothetical protein
MPGMTQSPVEFGVGFCHFSDRLLTFTVLSQTPSSKTGSGKEELSDLTTVYHLLERGTTTRRFPASRGLPQRR